jgi:hypothetical protein
MVALYYGVVPTKVRKTPRDLAQTSIYATLHQHRTLRCGGERRRRRVSGAFRTNHRRAMGELYQVKGNGPNQPGGRPNSRVTRGHLRHKQCQEAATILTSSTATLFVLFAAATGTELVSTRFGCLQPDCLPA